MTKLTTLLFALLVYAIPAEAQSGTRTVLLTGRVSEISLKDSSEKYLAGARVEIWTRGEKLSSVNTTAKGLYSCRLDYFNSYIVKYYAEGLVTKMVEIDATDFARETRERGFTMEVDMTLFKKTPGCREFEFLGDMPIGKARYSKRANTVVWDNDYTDEVNHRIRSAAASCRK